MPSIAEIRQKYKALSRVMDERSKRIWAATEATIIGWGGISAVSEATGIARNTIVAGIREVEARKPGRPPKAESARIRRSGAGRKHLSESEPGLVKVIESLVDSTTRGDPMRPLRWTCKSTKKISDELAKFGHTVSDRSVAKILKDAGYSLQANAKMKEGKSDPDRNAQFEYINKQTAAFQKRNQPVISVDTKKKELIGDFKNAGSEWRKKGEPEQVQVHDFGYEELGKGIPYGVYDVAGNKGWVSVGTDHDTAEFAVATIRNWWRQMGRFGYPKASELLIMADGGGSNGSRSKLWKVEVQKLADETGLKVSICHFPPGTSKWNKIEHRMFSFITKNWRGRPLLSHQVMVNLIGATTTKTGLKIKARLDNGNYETGRKVSAEDMKRVNIEAQGFRGDWNYQISPIKKRK